ncbi:nuclear transport factor 2 family protein [Streptomyces sp. NPDC005774]|uniref:nuclear transport factor 2 family protein n=1 Tax=Streptomyces sp. NPDC005774 TaxID=3364728 RepID=UPI0036AE621E
MTAPDGSRIADELEIHRLNALYNWACYERDAEAYAACFTPDGVYESGNTGSRNSGHEALAAGIRAAADSAWLMGHVTADSLVDIDGDEATQKVFVLLYRRESTDGDNAFFASGRYQDSLVRTAGGWKYSHRTSYIDRSQLPWARHAPRSPAG